MPKLCVKYICYICTIVTLLSDKEIILLGTTIAEKLGNSSDIVWKLSFGDSNTRNIASKFNVNESAGQNCSKPNKTRMYSIWRVVFFFGYFVCLLFLHFRGRMLLLLFSEGDVSPFKVCLLHRANSVS